jgi:hypothetical protein
MNNLLGLYRVALILSIGCFSCQKPGIEIDNDSEACANSNDSKSVVYAHIGDSLWTDTSFDAFLYSSVPWTVKCRPESDSLLIGFTVRPMLGWLRYVQIFLVLRNFPIRKYNELHKLNSKVWFLNDSSAYALFVDEYGTFSNKDTIRVTDGMFTIANVSSICGVHYGQNSELAIRMKGSFDFPIQFDTTNMPTSGKFDFFMTPFDEEIMLY